MDEIHVGAGPDNVQELRKRSATYRHTRFVWSQVAGDNVRTGGRIAELAEIAPAAQVGCRIDLFLSTEQRWRGARKKIGVAARGKFCRGPALWQPLQSPTALTI